MQALKQPQKRYTYADYLTWESDERCELIDGVIYMMAPAPALEHQSVVGETFRQLGNFLDGKPCKVFVAPVDVRLNADSGDNTVIQPDVLVVCDRSKLDGKAVNGAPDLVIEVISPSSNSHDTITKFEKYMKAGVREYWLMYPTERKINKCVLQNECYVCRVYSENDTVPVDVLSGCQIDLSKVFPPPPPPAEEQAE